jgi:glycolate oxidase FAD binding subunit
LPTSTGLRGEDLFPHTEAQAAEVITWAAQHKASLDLCGLGSKRAFGRPVRADHGLNLSALHGITSYTPAELVITAGTGTPLDEVRAVLAEQGQHLACEPLCLSPLWADDPTAPLQEGTLGGLVSGNLAGSRRFAAGAVRDHLLGLRGINGLGVPFKAGGQVVKNVTGFDLCKLTAGAWGTLVALTEVSLKVLPKPEKTRTLVVQGLDPAAAVDLMTAALSSPWEVSGAASLPAALAAGSAVDRVSASGQGVTLLRVEGPAPSVTARCQALQALVPPGVAQEELHSTNSVAVWEELRTCRLLAARRPALVWKLSVVPAQAAALAQTLMADLGGEVAMDWGGGLLWVLLPQAQAETADGGAVAVRRALASQGGGHATLVKAPAALRQAVAVFQPQAAPLAALTRRVKATFDPEGVFSPGRMWS